MDDDFDDGLIDSHDGLGVATAVGTGYALFRHGQDVQTRQIIEALRERDDDPTPIEIVVNNEPEAAVNTRVVATDNDQWDKFIGQEPLKRQLKVYIESAISRGVALPHTLLASGFPGVGKTHMARLIAKTLGVQMVELMPPFDINTLVKAASTLNDRDVLFIDEIHKLADSGKRGAEILLKVLEEGVAFLSDGTRVQLADITIIGATTDRDKLPEPVIDRFKIQPYYQPYSNKELVQIAMAFAFRNDAENYCTDDVVVDVALSCRGTPRIAEKMITAQRDLSLSLGRNATSEELLDFLEVEPDGLTRVHIQYLTSLYQFFPRVNGDGETEYVVGEAAIMQMLRETKQGIQRVEAFLVERGLVDRTPRGRRLTDAGIDRAREFVAAGKGAAA